MNANPQTLDPAALREDLQDRERRCWQRFERGLDPRRLALLLGELGAPGRDLVARDADGKVFTVRYEAVNAMLLNEFLKEHRKVEKQEAKIAEQEKRISDLTSSLQEVSARVDALTARPHPTDE